LDISYYGYFTPFGGYGISNINWVKHLVRGGVGVSVHGKFLPSKGTAEYKALDEEEMEVLYQEAFVKHELGIIETTPFNFDLIDTPIKIASTMCETDELGKPWVGACNSMDYVVVPNEFNREVFEESGVKKEKLKVIRPGTDTEKFPFYKRPVRDIYTFGMVGYMNDRKSAKEVIQAFCSEFEPWEPVRLYIKSSNKEFGYYSNFKDPRIVVDIRLLNFEELNKVYRSFDAFVFPSKAEGVGMPPREAMATGLPTIVMNYSGLEEIADPTYTYPIQPKDLVRGLNPRNVEQVGRWATVDIQELMYWMRYIFNHPEDAAARGQLASEWIEQEHSWESAVTTMKQFLREVKDGC